MIPLGCLSTYFRISIYYRMPNSEAVIGKCSGKTYSKNVLRLSEKMSGKHLRL